MATLVASEAVTERTLRRWKRESAAPGARRPVGRPRASPNEREAARELVLAELERQGWDAGERPIHKALVAAKRGVSLYRVRQELRELKAEHERDERARIEEVRQSVTVEARDAVWAIDATHLIRDEHGHAIEAEVLRDCASGRTLAVSIGRKATARDVIALLERTVAERGGGPLVLCNDNARAYCCAAIDGWCRRNGVVQLKSEPRTPQHNARAEHGIGELKRDAAVRSWSRCTPRRAALLRLVQAMERLDHARPRATRGWRTAAEADLRLPHWRLRVSRRRFYAVACCGIRRAVLDSPSRRAGRRAERYAILQALREFKLIQWTRGPTPDGSQ